MNCLTHSTRSLHAKRAADEANGRGGDGRISVDGDDVEADGVGLAAQALEVPLGGANEAALLHRLEHEAVDRAQHRKVAGVETKVVSVEYLAAIAVQTGRRKDREKVRRLLEEASLDRRAFEALLKRHDLYETFKGWQLQNRD